MTYRGHVRENVIVLDSGVVLPEGTEVVVETVSPKGTSATGSSLLERLGDFIGGGTDLPEDFAENHDHYIHGTPKK
jgi:hypothetical protein